MDEDKSAPHCVENVLYFSGVTPEKLYRRNGTSQSMALVFETAWRGVFLHRKQIDHNVAFVQKDFIDGTSENL